MYGGPHLRRTRPQSGPPPAGTPPRHTKSQARGAYLGSRPYRRGYGTLSYSPPSPATGSGQASPQPQGRQDALEPHVQGHDGVTLQQVRVSFLVAPHARLTHPPKNHKHAHHPPPSPLTPLHPPAPDMPKKLRLQLCVTFTQLSSGCHDSVALPDVHNPVRTSCESMRTCDLS